uniref:Uncharacterized protein n=1 Tax=Leersia perrieri TaxID=77586 RepID=A0A0D9XU84_9ORYZ
MKEETRMGSDGEGGRRKKERGKGDSAISIYYYFEEYLEKISSSSISDERNQPRERATGEETANENSTE